MPVRVPRWVGPLAWPVLLGALHGGVPLALSRGLEPEYLLTDGPYRLSRNPMHVGGIAIWVGWTIWFGSVPVAAGLAPLTGLYRAGVAWEERMLERRWGDEWR